MMRASLKYCIRKVENFCCHIAICKCYKHIYLENNGPNIQWNRNRECFTENGRVLPQMNILPLKTSCISILTKITFFVCTSITSINTKIKYVQLNLPYLGNVGPKGVRSSEIQRA